MQVRFVETPSFTADVPSYFSEQSYLFLQVALASRPEQGALIPGSGGLRKIRWPAPGRGKRGGLRVIYYWHRTTAECYLICVYSKTDHGHPTLAELRRLGRTILEEFR